MNHYLLNLSLLVYIILFNIDMGYNIGMPICYCVWIALITISNYKCVCTTTIVDSYVKYCFNCIIPNRHYGYLFPFI